MRVSTRGDYAARALLSLALHSETSPTSVREIAERTVLPQPYLEPVSYTHLTLPTIYSV